MNIDGCESIVDDIIIYGENVAEHDKVLHQVLTKLDESNLRLNKNKCEFRKTRLTFVGHTLTSEGVEPDDEKVRAVREMKKPENVKELMTFLGFVNYLGKFIQNLSDKSAPLRKLLEKDTEWHWDNEQEKAFEKLKKAVIEAPVLKYYDEKKPVTLSVDASSKGLGAVILQNGQPVAYASRALTTAQQNYAQIEKEALAISYGCTKFHQYLFAKEVHVESDHRPLQAIFAKPLYQAPPRLQRILLSLQKYDLKVRYKPGKEMYISDCLSRAYLDETKEDLNSEELTINLLTYLPVSDEKRKVFQKETQNDPEMKVLRDTVEQGWPEKKEQVPPELRPYWNFRDEITCIDDMLFKGHKLIVPQKLRPEMLNIIHEAHTGIVKCKARARESLFWLGMAQEVEKTVSECSECAENQKRNAKEPLLQPELPDRPWAKICVDLFHFRGQNYLLTVDRYSSWPEVAKLDNLSSENTISYLKSQFSRYGIPDEVYSDNGPQFASHSFKTFKSEYGFTHVTSSPTYAQSNGCAERGVQTVKSLLKKAKDPYKSLLIYRDTVLESTGLSPAQMFLGRRLKNTLPVTTPLLKAQNHDWEAVKERKIQAQENQKLYFDRHCGKQLSELQPGDSVMRRDHNKRWEPATVVRPHATPRSYIVVNNDGNEFRRNRRHLRKTKARFSRASDDDYCDTSQSDVCQQSENNAHRGEQTNVASSQSEEVTTRSGRHVKLPAKYSDFEM